VIGAETALGVTEEHNSRDLREETKRPFANEKGAKIYAATFEGTGRRIVHSTMVRGGS